MMVAGMDVMAQSLELRRESLESRVREKFTEPIRQSPGSRRVSLI
jgi:hypothetical protein